jgi:hypothetical protein
VTPSLDDLLVRTFPNLYRDRRADMRQTAMCWGFDCGDGWFGLLWELSRALEAELLLLPEGDRPCASQVKEKYGTLRFYMTGETEAMSIAIRRAEERSGVECGECGAAGEVRGSGWLECTCERHGRT